MQDPRGPISEGRASRLSRPACALVVLICLSGARAAQAQQSLDQPFADGFSLLTFEPAPSGDRFFRVSDGSVFGGDDRVRATLLGHYTLKAPLVRTDNLTGEERELV